jgi:hypothetical protein
MCPFSCISFARFATNLLIFWAICTPNRRIYGLTGELPATQCYASEQKSGLQKKARLNEESK